MSYDVIPSGIDSKAMLRGVHAHDIVWTVGAVTRTWPTRRMLPCNVYTITSSNRYLHGFVGLLLEGPRFKNPKEM